MKPESPPIFILYRYMQCNDLQTNKVFIIKKHPSSRPSTSDLRDHNPEEQSRFEGAAQPGSLVSPRTTKTGKHPKTRVPPVYGLQSPLLDSPVSILLPSAAAARHHGRRDGPLPAALEPSRAPVPAAAPRAGNP